MMPASRCSENNNKGSEALRQHHPYLATSPCCHYCRTYFYTDVALPACEVCFKPQDLTPAGVTYRGAWGTDIWSGHSRKWW